MWSKLFLRLGTLASKENDCSLNREQRIPEPKARLRFRPSGEVLSGRSCVYADGAWIPGALGQRTRSGRRPVAGGNPQLKCP